MSQLFLSRGDVLTAIITKMFKKMLHGQTSKLMTDIDIGEAYISFVSGYAGCHSGAVPKLQTCSCDGSFEEFISSFLQFVNFESHCPL